MIMRTCVILNPAAGRGWSPERIRRALSSIPGAELRVSPTSDSLRPLALAAVADGFERIVAAHRSTRFMPLRPDNPMGNCTPGTQ